MHNRRSTRFTLDDNGHVREAAQVPSPNFDDRPKEAVISLVVLHNISLPPKKFSGNAILRFFTNRLNINAHPYFSTLDNMRVSAHFLIRRQGELIQLVSCTQRAWHAGVSQWRGRPRCNDFSIGIELEGADDIPYRKAQYRTLNALLSALARAYPITDIVGHSMVAPERKTDPGTAFDWRRIARAYLPKRVTVHAEIPSDTKAVTDRG